jgi:hypothetical protein
MDARGCLKDTRTKFSSPSFAIWFILWLYIVRDVEHKYIGNKEFMPAVLVVYGEFPTAHRDACDKFYGQGAQV